MTMKKDKIDWKTVFKIGGAYAAYQIGAGFASGQETIQYFGTWGGVWPFVLPVIVFIWTIIYTISNYKVGATENFENPNEVFVYYHGPVLGRIMDYLVNITLALTSLVMFAGAGATVNQYSGLPVWVGAVGIGVISAAVVCLGLEKMLDVLGGCGILIIAVMIFVAVYGFITGDTSVMEGQKNVLKYVDEGIFLQASAFGTHNPILSILGFGGLGFAVIITFTTSMGKQCKNMKTCVASAVMSSAFYVIGIIMVCWTMLEHLDYIASIEAKVPMLAAVEDILPWMALPYCIIVLIGVFTTIAGYLWTCGRRVAPDGTWKQRIVVIAIAVVGITVGSMIPLDALVNFLFQIAGYMGIIMFVCVIAKEIQLRKSGGEKPFPDDMEESGN